MQNVFFMIMTAILCFVCTPTSAHAGESNKYNPYMHTKLPVKQFRGSSADLVESMGAHASSLQEEAQHRPFWKQEVYPVVFGDPRAPQEIIFFLDYAKSSSEAYWSSIVNASRSLNPSQCKVVIFAKNSEQYGTELMGGGIWVAHNRPSNALEYFTYTLQRWNTTKKNLAAQGKQRSFVYEYDAVSSATEYPILYAYLESIRPQLSAAQLPTLVKHAFDAGNVNMFQAVTAADEYAVSEFPAVVVNGKRLKKVSVQAILDAVR